MAHSRWRSRFMLALFMAQIAFLSGPARSEEGMINQVSERTGLSYGDMAKIIVAHAETTTTDAITLDHAKALLAGAPVKKWKNCLLDKAILDARQNMQPLKPAQIQSASAVK